MTNRTFLQLLWKMKHILFLYFFILIVVFGCIVTSIVPDATNFAIHDVISDNATIRDDLQPNLAIPTTAVDDILETLVSAQLTIITILVPLTFVVAELIGEYQSPYVTGKIVNDERRKYMIYIFIIIVIVELVLLAANNIIKYSSDHYIWIVFIIHFLIFLSIIITFYLFWEYLQDLKKKMVVPENIGTSTNKLLDQYNLGYYDYNIQPILDIFKKLNKNEESTTLEESLKIIRSKMTYECEKICKKTGFIYKTKINDGRDYSENFFGKVCELKKIWGLSKNRKKTTLFVENKIIPLIQDNTTRTYFIRKIVSGKSDNLINKDTPQFDRKKFHDTIVLFFRIFSELKSQAINSKFEKGVIIIVENIEFFLEDLDLLKDNLKVETIDDDDLQNFLEEYKKILDKYSDILENINKDATELKMENAIVAVAWGRGKLWELQIKDLNVYGNEAIDNIENGLIKNIEESGKHYQGNRFNAAQGILHVTAYYGRILLESNNGPSKDQIIKKLCECLNQLKLDTKSSTQELVNLMQIDAETSQKYSNLISSCKATFSLYSSSNRDTKGPFETYNEIVNTLKDYFRSMQTSIGSSYIPYIKLARLQSDYNFIISNYTLSTQQLEHVKKIVEYKYGPNHLQHAKILNHLSRIYLDICEIEKAIEFCDHASRIRILCGCPYLSSEIAASLINYSLIYRLKGNTIKAMQFLKEVREIRENGKKFKEVIAADIFRSTIIIETDLRGSLNYIKIAKVQLKKNYTNDSLFVGALHQAAIINCSLGYFNNAKRDIKIAKTKASISFGKKSTDYNSLLITELNILNEENNRNYSTIVKQITELRENELILNQKIKLRDKKNDFKLNNIEARNELYQGHFSTAVKILYENYISLYETYPKESLYHLASQLDIANVLFCYLAVIKAQDREADKKIIFFVIKLYEHIINSARENNYILIYKGVQENLDTLKIIISGWTYPEKIKIPDEKDIIEILANSQDLTNGAIENIKSCYNQLYRYKFKLELLPSSHKFSDHMFFYQMTCF
jgi:hypothetical protein